MYLKKKSMVGQFSKMNANKVLPFPEALHCATTCRLEEIIMGQWLLKAFKNGQHSKSLMIMSG